MASTNFFEEAFRKDVKDKGVMGSFETPFTIPNTIPASTLANESLSNGIVVEGTEGVVRNLGASGLVNMKNNNHGNNVINSNNINSSTGSGANNSSGPYSHASSSNGMVQIPPNSVNNVNTVIKNPGLAVNAAGSVSNKIPSSNVTVQSSNHIGNNKGVISSNSSSVNLLSPPNSQQLSSSMLTQSIPNSSSFSNVSSTPTNSNPIPGGGQPISVPVTNANFPNIPVVSINNMNAVRAAAVNIGAVSSPTAQVAGQPGARPRMILTPQMIQGSRPGQSVPKPATVSPNFDSSNNIGADINCDVVKERNIVPHQTVKDNSDSNQEAKNDFENSIKADANVSPNTNPCPESSSSHRVDGSEVVTNCENSMYQTTRSSELTLTRHKSSEGKYMNVPECNVGNRKRSYSNELESMQESFRRSHTNSQESNYSRWMSHPERNTFHSGFSKPYEEGLRQQSPTEDFSREVNSSPQMYSHAKLSEKQDSGNSSVPHPSDARYQYNRTSSADHYVTSASLSHQSTNIVVSDRRYPPEKYGSVTERIYATSPYCHNQSYSTNAMVQDIREATESHRKPVSSPYSYASPRVASYQAGYCYDGSARPCNMGPGQNVYATHSGNGTCHTLSHPRGLLMAQSNDVDFKNAQNRNVTMYSGSNGPNRLSSCPPYRQKSAYLEKNPVIESPSTLSGYPRYHLRSPLQGSKYSGSDSHVSTQATGLSHRSFAQVYSPSSQNNYAVPRPPHHQYYEETGKFRARGGVFMGSKQEGSLDGVYMGGKCVNGGRERESFTNYSYRYRSPGGMYYSAFEQPGSEVVRSPSSCSSISNSICTSNNNHSNINPNANADSYERSPFSAYVRSSLHSPPGKAFQERPGPYDIEGYETSLVEARMRTQRTQITLQALPGLPPGAQGHHLLVKTENGQYQLVRFGMPSPAPAAPSGTPIVPPSPSSSNPQIATSTNSINSPCNNTVAQQQMQAASFIGSGLPAGVTTTTSVTSSNTSFPLSVSSLPSLSSSSGPLTPVTTTTVATTTVTFPKVNQNLMSSSGSNNTSISSVPPSSSNYNYSNPISSTLGPVSSHTGNTNATTSKGASKNSSKTVSNPSNPANPPIRNPSSTVSQTNAVVNNTQSGVGMTASMSMQPQQPHPQAQAHPPFASTNAYNSVSQMSAETATNKCKNFLSFLLELSAKQDPVIARNVKNLIQNLVDSKVNAEDFSERLQKEVNSQPQPCLVGFLKKSLPPLRYSLACGELKIEGIKAPSMASVTVPPQAAPVTALIPQVRPQAMSPSPNARFAAPSPSTPQTAGSPSPSGPKIPNANATQRFTSPKTSKSSSKAKNNAAAASGGPLAPATPPSSSPSSSKPPAGPKGALKDKESKKGMGNSGFSGDDDINDVAAMGGVNLAEESQKILGSTEFVGTQIRSCRDETFLHPATLQSKIKAIAAKYGLEEPSPEVAALVSHAVEERLKTMLEKLSLIAEHRLDVIKMDDRYEVTQDVKGQLRFLEELERLEKKRHDEQEREMLIKAAKSRSKSEDPEQAKLKAKAKEMQRVQMEEMRQREANLTALQAIGPRKKPRLDTSAGSQASSSQSSYSGFNISAANRSQMALRPRIKRVNLRDLMFLFELEPDTMKSQFLYKHLLFK